MKEYKIDKKLADKIASILNPDQLKKLNFYKRNFNKYLIVDLEMVKIVVKKIDSKTGKEEVAYSVYLPEISEFAKFLE